MEQQIQDLIASIKKDGIEQAKAESDKIIADAKKKAQDIIEKAEAERKKMLEDAEHQIELERNSAEASIKQAARDTALSLRKNIEKTFQNILDKGVASQMKGDVLVRCLEAVIKSELDSSDIYLELSKSDFDALSGDLAKKFSSEIAKGLEFKPSANVQTGFRISQKNGESYIDMSSEECTKLLYPYLSDSLKNII